MLRFIKIERILAFSDHQDSNATNRINKNLIEYYTKKRTLWIGTLNQEIKSTVMDNYELENRKNV